jgi:hypothetical protein
MTPVQSLNVVSTSPFALMHGSWSTPMNQVFGLAFASFAVGLARLKPTPTMMSKPWSTYAWRSGS